MRACVKGEKSKGMVKRKLKKNLKHKKTIDY